MNGWIPAYVIGAILVLVVVALARVAASLRRTAVLLGRVSFGVRVEAQTDVVRTSVVTVNDRLGGIATALADLPGLATSAHAPACRR